MNPRYKIEEDQENNCLTITDTEYKLTNSFGSDNLILGNIEDATVIIQRLQFLEYYTHELEENLKYEGWTDDDLKGLQEDVEVNME